MNSKRTNYLLIGLLTVLTISIIGVAYGVNGLLESQSHKLVNLKTKLAALKQEQTQLAQVKKDIVAYNDLYHIAKVVVPQNKDQTETVRQIVKLANANHIYLTAITFPSSSLGSTTPAIGSPGSASATPVPAASSAGSALSQLKPVPNIPGVYDLQLNVVSANDTQHLATYPQLIGFLSSLEQNRLTAQVSSLSILPNTQDRSLLSFNLVLDVYIKPGKP